MKILKNDVDYEIEYTDIINAKKEFIENNSNKELIENYIGDNIELYVKQLLDYIKEIITCNTLEELADVLNKYTDTFGNGSQWYIKEI